MTDSKEHVRRHQVRAENPSGACGYVEHMTIDQLKARAVGEEFDATCPACGMFHLNQEEIDKLNSMKITESQHYIEMKEKAEAEKA